MKIHQIFLRNRWLSVMVLIFAGACNPSAPPPFATTAALRNTPTIRPTSTQTATVILSSTPTITPTSTSTNTPTSTFTLTPSWTPQNTLEPTQALELAESLLETNNGCLLPCWWGFTPGKTKWSEAQQFLETFASVHVYENQGEVVGAEVNLWVSKRLAGAGLAHFYDVENGVIQSMEVGPGFSPLYQFHPFIRQYGKPGEIWIDTFQNEDPWGVPFWVYLFYPERGILVGYGADAEILDDRVRGCLGNSQDYPKLGLWNPQFEMGFDEAYKLFRLDPDTVAYPIEQVSDMDVDNFYQAALDSEVCIETPAQLWPIQ